METDVLGTAFMLRNTAGCGLRLSAILLLATALAAQDRDARWRQDLQYLATELPARHINLYANMKQADFTAAVTSLNQAIPTLTDAEVMVGMAKIAAMTGDAHTSLFLLQTATGFRSFPLGMVWMEDGLFVTRASSSVSARALGTKLVQIGDTPIAQAYQALVPVIAHENDAWLRAITPDYLVTAEILQSLKLIPPGNTGRFTFEDRQGQRFSLDLPSGVATDQSALNSARVFVPPGFRNTSLNYWSTYLESSRLLYFAYNQAQEMSSQSFSAFAAQLLNVMDSKPVDALVFDVRYNTGGNTSVIEPLLAGLDTRLPKLLQNPNFRIFTFIGNRTISTGLLHACQARDSGAILIGEPTGGKPRHYGNISWLTLPNSSLRVSYSTKLFSDCGPDIPSLLPDISTPLSSSDFFLGHDPFLAAALAYVQGTPLPINREPSAGLGVVNAASFRPGAPLSSGALASAFGSFGATAADASSLPLSKDLGSLQVLVNNQAAPLLAVRSSQVNFQVPQSTASGRVPVRVLLSGKEVGSGTVTVASTGPGLFTVLNEDYRPNSESVRARAGSVVMVYATGPGAVNPTVGDGVAAPSEPLARTTTTPVVYFGSEPGTVLFSGMAPGFVGLWQINVRLPASNLPSGQVPVFVGIGGLAGNAVPVWIE